MNRVETAPISAVSIAPAISLGSAFPERASASFVSVARLDSGPIGGWGPGLASPEPVSFGSRSGFSFSSYSALAEAARPNIGSIAVPEVFQTGLADISLDPEVEPSRLSTFESVLAQAQISVLLAQAGRVEVAEPLPKLGVVPVEPEIQPTVIQEVAQPTSEIKLQPQLRPHPEVKPKIAPAVKVTEQVKAQSQPEVESDIQTSLQSRLAAKTELKGALDLEKKVFKKIEKKKTAFPEDKELEVNKRRIVIDKVVLATRLYVGRFAAKLAFRMARLLGKDTVTGKDVAQFVPEEYDEVRSGVLKEDKDNKLPDGTYELAGIDIEHIGKVYSEEQLITKVEDAIYPHKPLMRIEGDLGEAAKAEQVDEVYIHTPKRPPVVEIIVTEKEGRVIEIEASQPEQIAAGPAENRLPTPTPEPKIINNPDLLKSPLDGS